MRMGIGTRVGVAALLCGSGWACAQQPVYFDWFEYRGEDAVFATHLPPGHYRNPVLAGFHPDPSITRVGNDFYLVHSTFTYYPGIPVFRSTDLVHWTQIGNVIERPEQLDFDGLRVSRGVFAPTIQFKDGVFYVLNTAVDNGGNFLATARDPAGPWSDPVWLPTIDGIDPALFFDTDGKTYLLNNGPPAGPPRYDGHRAIWMQAFDLAARRPFGPRRVLIDGGVDPSTQPIWIEGPHIYRRAGWYYLVCAEGGTGPNHSQVVLRSRKVWGPYIPFPHNPILTQRDLPAARAHPVTNAGHADLVEAPDGSWWATFLGSRTYGEGHYNTGRETFLLPVTWRDGWPVILDAVEAIPAVVAGPAFMARGLRQAPASGNFRWRDDFDQAELDRAWLRVRVPKTPWVDLRARPGQLAIQPLAERLDTLRNPAFLARRQQHLKFSASLALSVPEEVGTEAGIAAFQNERHWYFLGLRRRGTGLELFLEQHTDDGAKRITQTSLLTTAPMVRLRIRGDRERYAFGFDGDGRGWRWLLEDVDGTQLSTTVAGGFVGAVLGPHVRREEGTDPR